MSRESNRPTKTNYQDYLFDFSDVDFSQGAARPADPSATGQATPTQERGFLERLGYSALAIGEGLPMLPGRMADTIRDAWNGGDIDVTDTEALQEREQRAREQAAYAQKYQGKAFDGVTDAMISMPYSLTTLAAGIGASVPATLAAGPVAGGAAAMAASGGVAYRASKQEFMENMLEETSRVLGRRPTQEEWDRIAADFDSEATQYGLWEAGPEALGNLFFTRLLGPLGKGFLTDGLGKTVKRGIGLYGGEMGTEAATQMGQGHIAAEMGWRDEAPGPLQALKEIAPATFWQTTLMAGGKKGLDLLAQRYQERAGQKGMAAGISGLSSPASPPPTVAPESPETYERDFASMLRSPEWNAPDMPLDQESWNREARARGWNHLVEEDSPASSETTTAGMAAGIGGLSSPVSPQTPTVAPENPKVYERDFTSTLRSPEWNAPDMPLDRESWNREARARGWNHLVEDDLAASSETTTAAPGLQPSLDNGEHIDLLRDSPAPENGPSPSMPSTAGMAAGIGGLDPLRASPAADTLQETPLAAHGTPEISAPSAPLPPLPGVASGIGGLPFSPAQPAPRPPAQIPTLPTQAQLTRIQEKPRADTTAAAERLGIPGPEAVPQEAQRPELSPAMPQQTLPNEAQAPTVLSPLPAPAMQPTPLPESPQAAPQQPDALPTSARQPETSPVLPPAEPVVIPPELAGLSRKELIRRLPRQLRGKADFMGTEEMRSLLARRLARTQATGPEQAGTQPDTAEEKTPLTYGGKPLSHPPIGDARRENTADAVLAGAAERAKAEGRQEMLAAVEDMQRERKSVGVTHDALWQRITDEMLPYAGEAGQEEAARTGAAPEDAGMPPARKVQAEQRKGSGDFSDVVAHVPSNAIRKTEKLSAIAAAKAWIRKHIFAPAKTEIGDVEVDANAIQDSLSHSMYQNKLDAVQAIVPVLEKGSYLGMLPDKDGNPIENHYFAGRVRIGENEKIVFVRTRQAKGTPNRFYVHEVFTQEEIEKSGDFHRVTSDADRPYRNSPDFYRSILANYLKGKTADAPGAERPGDGISSSGQSPESEQKAERPQIRIRNLVSGKEEYLDIAESPRRDTDDEAARRTDTDRGAAASPAGAFGTIDAPDTVALAAHFSEAFLSGKKFGAIIEARREAGSLLGGTVRPATEAAKAVDEAVELGVTLAARRTVAAMRERHAGDTDIYRALVDLYQRQPRLNVRTSTSIAQQAYSTPAPIAFLASRLAGIDSGTRVFEPTAGNGMLLLEASPDRAAVNELNPDRASRLRSQGFEVTERDAVDFRPEDPVDVVIANPPFGRVKDADRQTREFSVNGLTTKELDHAIVARALESLKQGGRAVLIIGGKQGNDASRSKKYRAADQVRFWGWLFERYRVLEHFCVDGKLYERQGAGYPIDVIVLENSGTSAGRPFPGAALPRVYTSFNALEEVLHGQVVDTAERKSGSDGTDTGRTGDGANQQRGRSDRPADAAGSEADRGSVRSGGNAGADGARSGERLDSGVRNDRPATAGGSRLQRSERPAPESGNDVSADAEGGRAGGERQADVAADSQRGDAGKRGGRDDAGRLGQHRDGGDVRSELGVTPPQQNRARALAAGDGALASLGGRRRQQPAAAPAGQFLPPRKKSPRHTPATLRAMQRDIAALNARTTGSMAHAELIATQDELPASLREQFAGTSVEGVYDSPTGNVWLIAENLASPQRAVEVWAHETLVHYGLRATFDEGERRNLLNDLWLALGGMKHPLIAETARRYGKDPRSDSAARPVIVEEALAKLAEQRGKNLLNAGEQRFWRRVVAAVLRAWHMLVRRVTGRSGSMDAAGMERLLDSLQGYVLDGRGVHKAAFLQKEGALASLADAGLEAAHAAWRQLQEDMAAWGRLVDDFDPKAVIKGGKTENLKVGNTPDVLRKLGAPALPMTMSAGNLAKILSDKKDHQLPKALVKQIPAALAEPVMVFESATVSDALVVLTELKHEGRSVMVAVHLDKKQQRVRVNEIASAYKRSDAGWYTRQIAEGRLLYQDKKKSLAWARTHRLQLPKVRRLPARLSGKRILNENDVVKPAAPAEAALPALADNEKSPARARTHRLQLPKVRRLPARLSDTTIQAEEGSVKPEGAADDKTRSPRWFRERAGLQLSSVVNRGDYRGIRILTDKNVVKPVAPADEAPLASLRSPDTSWRERVAAAVRGLRNIAGRGVSEDVQALLDNPEQGRLIPREDLGRMERLLKLPHWVAKDHPQFATIYNRQLRRVDERRSAVLAATRRAPLLFDADAGKRLNADEERQLGEMIWKWDGREPDALRDEEKFTVTGTSLNGREELELNPRYQEKFRAWLREQPEPERVKEAFAQVRALLDESFLHAYQRMSQMIDMNSGELERFRADIRHLHNYFPHQRRGKYYVEATATGPDGKRQLVYRQHFDVPLGSSVREEWAKIVAANEKDYPGATWHNPKEVVQLPDDILGAPLDPQALEQLINTTVQRQIKDGEQAEEVRKALLSGLADVLKARGFGAHAIQRKNIPGFDRDDIKGILYNYISGLHGWLSKMDASADFAQALGKISAQKSPELWSFASQYVKDMLRNADSIDRIAGNIKTAAFVWYLGINIKTAVVNSTQNLIVGVPRLQQEVTGGGALWIKAAMDTLGLRFSGRGIAGAKALKADELRMLEELYGAGVIADAHMDEIRGQMARSPALRMWERLVRVLGMPMSIVEHFNRASLALAAYRAARAGRLSTSACRRLGVREGERLNHDMARDFADMLVRDTHFEYGKGNAPELLRSTTAGRMLSPAFVFRSYSGNIINLWWRALRHEGREGRVFVAKSLGATVALGGLTAFPFYATLSALCTALSGDDEDWTTKVRRRLPESNLFRDVVCYGLPSLAGVTIGGSLRMETPFTEGIEKGTTFKEIMTQSLVSLIGVPYDLAVNKVSRALEAHSYGADDRALEALVPTFMANIMQARRLATEGQTTLRGRPINSPGQQGARKLDAYEAFGKALGFQPTSSARSYAAYKADKLRSATRSDRIDDFTNLALRDLESNGHAYMLRELRKRLQTWNAEMEEEGKTAMRIMPKEVLRRVTARRRENRPSREQRAKGAAQMALWGV